jgi:hypothetical protein
MLGLVLGESLGRAQQTYELSSSEEYATNFTESGLSASQHFTYSDGPGVGGLPGRVDLGPPCSKGLFYSQPLLFVRGHTLSASTLFRYVNKGWAGRHGNEILVIAFAETTTNGLWLCGPSSYLAALLVDGIGPGSKELALIGRPGSSACDAWSRMSFSPDFYLTDAWYELVARWTLIESNTFEGTVSLFSRGPAGTGPRVEVCRHATTASIPELDVTRPLCLGLTGAGGEVPHLDNICLLPETAADFWPVVHARSLRRDGLLTWESDLPSGFYGLECSEDLGGEWRPSAFWNVALTGAENSLQIPLGAGSAAKLFFRVVCSQHELPLPRGAGAWEVRADRGLVRGKVTFWEGNFMPPASGTILPARRPIFVFEKTQVAQTVQSASGACFYSFVLSRLVDTTESGEDGYYQIALPPGDYSLFVLERSGDFYANEFGGVGGVYVNPVTVQANQTVEKDIKITYKATF